VSAVLKVYDKTLGRERKQVISVRLVSQKISVRDIISRRIQYEANALLQRYQKSTVTAPLSAEKISNLVVPGFVETVLNGPRKYGGSREGEVSASPLIDMEQQLAVAFEAFEKNQFLLLFDDKQVTSLDQDVTVTDTSSATFIRLVPLVGG
jgi:hypothetical protein